MNKRQILFSAIILIITATFFRFWRISETAPFLGDQGRDLIEIRHSLLAKKLPLVGPLSNQEIHAGPIYYYLIIPPLLLFRWQPIGPILFFTLFGVISVFLLWILGNFLFGPLVGFLISLLYAFSSFIIEQTKGFWNPIPIPMFTLGSILSAWLILEKKIFWFFLILGLSLSVAIQLYPPAYFLFLIFIFWWIFSFKQMPKENHKNFIFWSFMGLIVFIILFFPFLLFQFQNDFIDIKNIILLILEKFLISNPRSTAPYSPIILFINFLSQTFQSVTAIINFKLNIILGILILLLPILAPKKYRFFWPKFFSIWLIGGLLLASFYPSPVHPHYLSFLWPIPFLLFGFLLKFLKNYFPLPIIFLIEGILIFNQLRIFLTNFKPKNDLGKAEIISQTIIKEAENLPLALTYYSPKSPSDGHIRYLLLIKDAKVKSFDDPEVRRYFLVCEPFCLKPPTTNIFDSECFPKCPSLGQERKIDFTSWAFLKRVELEWASIYIWQAK